MQSDSSKSVNQFSFIEFSIFSAIVWTLLIMLSVGWNLSLLRAQAVGLATQEARANWNKDQAFRRWATRHGGLYVRPDERTPPNPYLSHLPYRDVETTDGVKLTLMNPAYMMSQMTKEFEEMYGIKGRITGKVLLNPANKPDAWELAALERFDEGEKEVTELSDIEGAPYLRLMKPMIMRPGCVACHGHLGFKVGDIRGGVSISIPLLPYMLAEKSSRNFLLASHAGIWGLGLLGIGFFAQRSRQRAIEQRLVDKTLSRSTAVIKEREQQISDLLNSTAEGIYGLDMEGNCTLANPACVELLGFTSADELIGKNMHALIHHSHEDGSVYELDRCGIYKSFKTNSEIHCNTEVFWRADGSCFPVEYWAYPILRDDKVSGTVVTFIDISERLRTEQILRRSQKMDALGQLTGGIAHDFNNQLGIVSGYLEILEENNEDNQKARQWIAASRKATRRCVDLTRQLLNFSRQQQVNTELIDFSREMNELRELIQRTVTPAVEVIYDIAEDLWPVKTSRGDLEDALLNLVINARDAMPEGGTLTISMCNKVLSKHEFGNEEIQPGDYVVIAVSDSGSGIPRDIQEHIFDPFFSTKEVGKGTGLGMSMVYGFVKRNRGCINLYSEPGEGTRINMYFPRGVEGDAQQAENRKKEKMEARGRNETVLVVEDEAHLRELALEILDSRGYRALSAENGDTAIDILRGEAHIDLLFCDIVMPGGMNGYQVAEQAGALRPGIKVQLTSGLADIASVNTQQTESGLNILQKPYSRSDLINCINKNFGR